MPATPEFTEIEEGDVADVVALWQRAGLTRPWNDPQRDIAFARDSANATVLVGRAGPDLVASVMVGHDGHRGVVYYLSVAPEAQRNGLGRAAMAAAEEWLRGKGVWKINLMIRADNAAVRGFYEALGYVVEERTVMARRIAGDDAG